MLMSRSFCGLQTPHRFYDKNYQTFIFIMNFSYIYNVHMFIHINIMKKENHQKLKEKAFYS